MKVLVFQEEQTNFTSDQEVDNIPPSATLIEESKDGNPKKRLYRDGIGSAARFYANIVSHKYDKNIVLSAPPTSTSSNIDPFTTGFIF